MTTWSFILGAPLVALGLAAVLATERAAKAMVAFPRCEIAGWLLCAIGWLGTAYECDKIGIDVFDKILKVFPGEVWILAAVLTVLTCMWMANLLPIRGLCAIFMLFPAELFPAVRLCDTGWRIPLVVFAYVCAITGMFGMFYPWRIRQALAWCASSDARVKAFGGALLGAGALFCAIGLFVKA